MMRKKQNILSGFIKKYVLNTKNHKSYVTQLCWNKKIR